MVNVRQDNLVLIFLRLANMAWTSCLSLHTAGVWTVAIVQERVHSSMHITPVQWVRVLLHRADACVRSSSFPKNTMPSATRVYSSMQYLKVDDVPAAGKEGQLPSSYPVLSYSMYSNLCEPALSDMLNRNVSTRFRLHAVLIMLMKFELLHAQTGVSFAV